MGTSTAPLPLSAKRAITARKKIITILVMVLLLIGVLVGCLFVGSSSMSFTDTIAALFKQGSATNIRIVWNIRIPRILAGLLAGGALAISGLIMQTTLGNIMASPSTLGVSNAAIFGANLSMIIFAGGFINTGNNARNYLNGINPYAASLMAFIFSIGCVLLILALSSLRRFSPNVIVLAGIAIGSVFTGLTSLIQFFATDIGLSAGVLWSFGDLERGTYTNILLIAIVLVVSFAYFMFSSWRYNALLGGEGYAKSLGIRVGLLRLASLVLASLLASVTISTLGMIGFIGIICPHAMRKIIGNNHTVLLPTSLLAGAILLLVADMIGRLIAGGSTIPVGAVTSVLGAPFFLYLIFTKKEATYD
ncbi:MAG: iron ABC transporter permease [Bacilli bacterium]|nr:iron ABC transporter permease [Bacilli bacterium]